MPSPSSPLAAPPATSRPQQPLPPPPAVYYLPPPPPPPSPPPHNTPNLPAPPHPPTPPPIPSSLPPTLDKQAAWLNQYNKYSFTIEGHADERGTREYNFALGERRAQAVHDYLAAKGISPSRMRTISYGKERPVAVCDDISCWSQNRRAVTVLNGAPTS